MSTEDHTTDSSAKQLRLIACGGCDSKVFIPSDLPPLAVHPCPKCDYPVMIPMELRQYELRDLVGQGGMGNVYRAWDTMLEREVAIKLMKKELMEDSEALNGFYQEAQACAALNHTNIIHIYYFDQWEGQLFLVMEIADCGSLDERIEQERQVPELDVLDIGTKVASALNCALKHNLLHRDIKPGNILFNAEGEPKLVDFGLARSAEEEVDENEAIWGTPYYIAPEKIERTREDFLSDLYSLAGTLYHALMGQVPFEAPTIEEVVAAHVHTPLTPPNHINPNISQPTSDALVRAMEKNPDHRFQSYDEFIMALTAARSQLLLNQYSTSGSTNSKSWWRR